MKNFIAILLFVFTASAQVGIGTNTPDISSALDIVSADKGVLIPRLTEAQKNAIPAPAEGLLIYQTNNLTGFWYYNGTLWTTFASGDFWSKTGNFGTDPTTNFLGSTNNRDLSIVTNSTQAINIRGANQRVSIGLPIANRDLHLRDNQPAFVLQDGSQAFGRVLTSDANGNASWQNLPTAPGGAPDTDWGFVGAGTTNADPISRTGAVLITTSAFFPIPRFSLLLDVYTGSPDGVTVGLGNVENLLEGLAHLEFSHRVIPQTDNTAALGKTGRRWEVVFATNGPINTSDLRDKTSIEPLNYGFEQLERLTPISYKWKQQSNRKTKSIKERKTKLGFSAQELKKVLPEVVWDSEYVFSKENLKEAKQIKAKRLGVCYNEILPVVVKSIQQKQQKMLDIEKEQKAIEQLLSRLGAVNSQN